MANPPSEKLTSLRVSLLREKIANAKTDSSPTATVTVPDMWDANKSADMNDWWISVAGDKIAELAFALALPEPADSAECSEQIEALKGGGGAFEYARSHREFGEAVLARMVAAYGDDRDALPAVVKVGELRAVATGTSNG